jgi:choline dehydrogenase-like flavoprotein
VKADAEQAVARPALAAHPNLTLITGTTVERLLTDASGRSVTGLAATHVQKPRPQTFTKTLARCHLPGAWDQGVATT